MSPALHVDESVTIPEEELRWTLPDDPAVGRADPTLGGFVTKLTVDVTMCAGLGPRQRRMIRDRVAGFHRTGDIIVSNADGVITVMVDWAVEYPESAHLAREHLAAALRAALMP